MYRSTISLNSAVDWVSGQHHAPAALTPGKRPGNLYTEGGVGPTAELDGCGKSRPTPRFDPRNTQPVTSRYNH